MHRLFWLFGVAACLHGVPDDLPDSKPLLPAPEPVIPPEQPIAAGDRTHGPLDVEAAPIDAAARLFHNEAEQRDYRRPLDADGGRADAAALERLAAFYPNRPSDGYPLAELASLVRTRVIAHRYSVAQLTYVLREQLDARGLCIVPAGRPGIERSCGYGIVLPPPSTQAPFEITEPQPGTVHLIVRTFDADPRWQTFADARARLRHASGIVLDLRGARGDDPRAVLPWLEELTGRSPLRPLRAIDRPAGADAYVAAYAARFLDRPRDRDVWSALVGTMPEAKPHPAVPITILPGDRCDAACELVARVLETYGNAVAYGPVRAIGRLAYDEPALLVLPTSKSSVYFFATHFVLAPEIEAATGPTDEWHRRHAHAFGIDDAVALEFADRDVAQRRTGAWPRCTALPYVREPRLLTPTLLAKIPTAARWEHGGCPSDVVAIALHARAPSDVVLDLLNSCGLETFHFGGGANNGTFVIDTSRSFPFGVLAQLAAHPLIDSVELECPGQGHWD